MNLSNSYVGQPVLDASIRKTLTNTFLAIGCMWLITAIGSYATLNMRLGIGGALGGLVVSIALIFAVRKFQDSAVGLGLLGLFALIQGLVLGPVMNHYLSLKNGPQLVMMAAGMTTLATFACAAYCTTTRKSFSKLGGFLFAGLIVLLVASLIAMFFPTPAVQLTISVLSCLLFTAFMLYDISNVVNGQETNYISAALGIYLDMLNMFTSLLRILGVINSDD